MILISRPGGWRESTKCSKSDKSSARLLTCSLNWCTAVAADCNSPQRSSNRHWRSSILSPRASTSLVKWSASPPEALVSFAMSFASFLSSPSGFLSAIVSSLMARTRSSNFGSFAAPPRASCEANRSSHRHTPLSNWRSSSLKSLKRRAHCSRSWARINNSLFNLSQRSLMSPSWALIGSLSMSQPPKKVSPVDLVASKSPDFFQTSLRKVCRSLNCWSICDRFKTPGRRFASFSSAFLNQDTKDSDVDWYFLQCSKQVWSLEWRSTVSRRNFSHWLWIFSKSRCKLLSPRWSWRSRPLFNNMIISCSRAMTSR